MTVNETLLWNAQNIYILGNALCGYNARVYCIVKHGGT